MRCHMENGVWTAALAIGLEPQMEMPRVVRHFETGRSEVAAASDLHEVDRVPAEAQLGEICPARRPHLERDDLPRSERTWELDASMAGSSLDLLRR